jgi:hypothetical protein
MDPSQLSQLLGSKQSLILIANKVSAKISRKLNNGEIQELRKCAKKWASNYTDQVDDIDDADSPTFKNIQTDIAKRFFDYLKKRSAPPVSIIDTKEMLKSEINGENVVIHEASGFAELKYQDEYCGDNQSNAKFGGPVGDEHGIFGEQPTIVSQGGRPKTLRTIQAERNSDMEAERQAALELEYEQHLYDPITGRQLETGNIDRFLSQYPTSGGVLAAERGQELMVEQNVMTEDMKLLLDDLKKYAEYFYKKDKKIGEIPPEEDPSKIAFQDAYLIFDSRNRDLSLVPEDNPGKFRWLVSNIPFLQSDGSAGVIFELSDIIEMEIDSFQIPLDNTFNNSYNRVSLFIEEISTQAVMSSENTRYHMMFETSVQGSWLKLTPLRRKMIFRDPIRFLTQATFVFRYPFQIVPFCKDRLTAVSTPGSNPALWTTAEPHCLNTNDIVYFTDVDTGDAAINTLLNDVNGLPIIKINSTQFTINVNFATVLTPITTVPYFGSKRILITLRFRCLSRGKETNFIKAVGEHIL